MGDGAWLVALVLACMLAVQVGLRFVITYELSQHEMRVMLFRIIKLSVVQFSDIASVEVMSFARLLVLSIKGKLFWAARAGNRLYSREVVVVRRRPGRGRALILSPDCPEDFARQLERHA